MLLENSENEETFLIYLFEWEPGLAELNSNFLPKWDTLLYIATIKWFLLFNDSVRTDYFVSANSKFIITKKAIL